METIAQNALLDAIIKMYNNNYVEHAEWKYKEEYMSSDFIQSYLNHFHEMKNIEANAGIISVAEELALYHMEYFMFCLLGKRGNLKKARIHFQFGTGYANVVMESVSQACQCFCPPPSIWMKNAGLFLACEIISPNNWDKVHHFSNLFIDSINGNNCLIGYGHPMHKEAWFLIDLYCKAFEKDYSSERAHLPDEYDIHMNILNEWNTTDPAKLSLFLTQLCELHLYENNIAIKQQVAQEEEGDAVEYTDVKAFLFPYEILAWLATRKHHGLENPTEFSHPLMNTPIAKFFLELETPLPKPKELPFAKELLTKLKEKCPNIEGRKAQGRKAVRRNK